MHFKNSKQGAGLVNKSNQCYINSTLQALFHIPSVYNWLMNDPEHQSLCKQSPFHFECLICAMHQTLVLCQARSGGAVQPDLINTKLKLFAPNLEINRQEDCHDFLLYLFHGMQESYMKAIAGANKNQLDSQFKETTPLHQIFGCDLRTEVTCSSCEHISPTLTPLTELTLDINQSSSLDQALGHFFAKELLSTYRCENCGNEVSATKQFFVAKPPKVLQLQLKRFNFDGSKNSRSVLVPHHLEFDKYLYGSNPYQSRSSLKYKLVSAVIHHGSSTDSGHYTCIGSTSNGVYHHFNDEMVSPETPPSRKLSQAYVIMYERSDEPTLRNTGMVSIQKPELHHISKHPSSLHPKQVHASQQTPQDVKHPRGTNSNIPQEDTQKHLDTKDADGWETVTGRHSRYRNGKQTNLQSGEVFLSSIENTDTCSLSSLFTETSTPLSNAPPPSSKTLGNKNNDKPTAAKEKRPIGEKEQGRPIISSVEVSKYKEEEVTKKKKTITINKLNVQQINWQNVASALNTLNISVVKYETLVDLPLPLLAKCPLPQLPTPTLTTFRKFEMNITIGDKNCLDHTSLNNECPQEAQATLYSETSNMNSIAPKSSLSPHKSCESTIENNAVMTPMQDEPVSMHARKKQEEEEEKKANLTLNDIFYFSSSDEGDDSSSPKISFVKHLSHQKTHGNNDNNITDLEYNRTLVLKHFLPHQGTYENKDNDINELEYNGTPVLKHFLPHQETYENNDNDINELEYNGTPVLKHLPHQETYENNDNDINELEYNGTPVLKHLPHQETYENNDNDINELEYNGTPVLNHFLPHQETYENNDNDINELEYNGTPVLKHLPHQETYENNDNDINELEYNGTPVLNHFLPHQETYENNDNDINELEYNGTPVLKHLPHQETYENNDNDINELEYNGTPVLKHLPHQETRDSLMTPNCNDQTISSCSNLTLSFNSDTEDHFSSSKVPTKKRKNSLAKVKRNLFKSKLSPYKRAFFTPTPVKETARLPFGTMNLFGQKHNETYLNRDKNETFENIESKDIKKNNKKKFPYKEGEIVLTNDEWEILIDKSTGRLDPFLYPPMLFGKYLQAVNNTCVINSSSKRKSLMHHVIYGKCLHKDCKSFKVICSPTEHKSNMISMKIELFSGGLHYLHNPQEQHSRQVRGVERLIHGHALKEKTADNYRDAIVTKTREVKIDAGNMDQIRHLSTFQKVRSEYKLSDDLDRNDYVDMCMMMKSMKESKGEDKLKSDYVQCVVEYPFTVHLYSKEQGDVISLLQNQKRKITAHIDSTGNLVRKNEKTSKRIFYYVLLINVPEDIKFQHEDVSHTKERSGTLFPVAEMITADHTIPNVLAWLTQFHFFIYKNCKLDQPIFTNIVSDQSFALLNATSFCFNDSNTIFLYLNMCHKVLTDQIELSDRTTIINLCSTHYVKTIMRTIEPFFPGKKNNTREKIMLMIALLFNCKDYKAIQLWFRHFVIILSSKTISSQFESAYGAMLKAIREEKTYLYDSNEIPTATCPPNTLEYEETSKSAMYREFLDISNQVVKDFLEENTCKTENAFYNPQYLTCFLKRHVPFIPMFTPVMISKRGIPCRQSNANVESYFSQIKNYIHVGPHAEKCSRFVKNIREHVIEPKLKIIKLNIQSHQSYKKRAYKRKDLHDNEKWGKNQPRKYMKKTGFDPFMARISRANENTMDTNIPEKDISDGQQNEVQQNTSQVQENEILSQKMSQSQDTENIIHQNVCQVGENEDSERKSEEKNYETEEVHSLTTTITTNSSISESSLFPEYVYSQKIDKLTDEWKRHEKNNIVKDFDYYKPYPEHHHGDHYIIAKVGGPKREIWCGLYRHGI
ncbi:hypothetical protein WDU94_012088 [Cyamophila willieti]